jgi:hypothetical protein
MQIGLGGMTEVVAVVSFYHSSRSTSWSHNFENIVDQLPGWSVEVPSFPSLVERLNSNG